MGRCRCGHLDTVHHPRCRVCADAPGRQCLRLTPPPPAPPPPAQRSGAAVGALVLCDTIGDSIAAFFKFETLDDARAFPRPCRPKCRRVHLLAWYEENLLAGLEIFDDRVHLGRAKAIAAAYPREPIHPAPEFWPAPASLNPPLRQPEEPHEMSLHEAAARAREIASASIDPSDHAYAHALQGAIDAERHALDRSLDPQGDTSDLPTWSEISREGEHEWLWSH